MTTYLIDTHLLLWSAAGDKKLSARAASLIDDGANTLLFSSVSIAEIAIKWRLKKPGFPHDPLRIRAGLLDEGYAELELNSIHALRLADLPLVHGDPFDRLLIAQALAEGIEFVTADALLARYPGQVTVV